MHKTLSKTISAFLTVVLILIPLASCARKIGFEEGKLKVVTTVYPVYDFTTKIAGDKADVKLLVKPGSDPHSWELSTDDMVLLEEADLLVANGANMEPWLDTCLDALDNKDIEVCIASSKLDLITFGNTTDDAFEDFENDDHHDHDELDHDGHDHSANGIDPHTWLSLDNAMAEIDEITEALIKIDSANSDYYKANADSYKSEIMSLKLEEEAFRSKLENKTIVVSHEAFGYMCIDFDMMQLPIEGISSDSEPDARTVSIIIDFIRANDVKVIYYDSIINPSAAEVISDETGCELIMLHSFGSVTAKEYNDGLSYVDAMRDNLDALSRYDG